MFKKITSLILVLSFVFFAVSCSNETTKTSTETPTATVLEYENKTVILHSNDVHGKIDGYAYMATLKKSFEEKGASVITVDNGDFSAGSLYLSETEGKTAIAFMNAIGYDVAGIGNHDFAFGVEKLLDNLSTATFKPICANVFANEELLFPPDTIITKDGISVGFFGITTPETYTKVSPSCIAGIDFASTDKLYAIAQEEVNALRSKCDIIICIAHLGVNFESLGNRSLDLYENTSGIDFIIDGHSHTVMDKGENGEPIQSTGTAFENIGVIEIDNATKKIEKNYLIKTTDLEQDVTLLNLAQNSARIIDYRYNRVFAKTEVDLDGERATNRSSETNLGDLITDAMRWYITEKAGCSVDNDHVLAMLNGGAIRANLKKGDVSKADVHNVLPFENTLTVNYVSGKDILEILEASTFCTPELVGGFPQVSGIEYSVNTTIAFDQGDLYPNSTYYAPKTIQRITIDNINGKGFNENDTYAIISNNFCAEGGDTYYALKKSKDAGNIFDTGITLDEIVIKYITEALGGIIGTEYSTPLGRIQIIK